MNKTNFKTVLLLTLACIFTAALLAEGYSLVNSAIDSKWMSAAIIHSAIAMLVLGWLFYQRKTTKLLSFKVTSDSKYRVLREKPWFVYLISIIVLGAVASMVIISRQFPGFTVQESSTNLSWILWIPLAEEMTFRVGLGGIFRKYGGNLWGAYFSALLFALVHSNPTFSNIFSGQIGLPIGPLLLALACEAIYINVRHLWPIVALHAACNATVMIFATGDARWFKWLGFLYL